jgi:hypothetical protein
MTGLWAVTVLLAVVVVVDSVAIVALARQVGVLHLRLKPLPGTNYRGDSFWFGWRPVRRPGSAGWSRCAGQSRGSQHGRLAVLDDAGDQHEPGHRNAHRVPDVRQRAAHAFR